MPKLRKRVPSCFLGVDPGQNGGLVAYYNHVLVEASKMPATERDIWEWFRLKNQINAMAVIEKVHSMPKQGVASSFKFGYHYGLLRMALIGNRIPFEEVTPRAWQKGLDIPPRKSSESPTQWKNRLKGLAQQYFPGEKVTLATADALLIALYCERKHGQK